MDFGPRSVVGLPPAPSKGIPQGVMPADDKSAHQTHQGVEAVGVQRLRAFTSRSRRLGSSRKAPSTLGLSLSGHKLICGSRRSLYTLDLALFELSLSKFASLKEPFLKIIFVFFSELISLIIIFATSFTFLTSLARGPKFHEPENLLGFKKSFLPKTK